MTVKTMDAEQIQILMEQLVQDQTLVSLELPSRDYYRLTVITAVRHEKKEGFFLIDTPQGFLAAVGKSATFRVNFEFTGRDMVKYKFTSRNDRLDSEEIWLAFPEDIERIQRRRHFRVPCPSDIKLRLHADGSSLSNDVINISMGGALFIRDRGVETNPVFEMNQVLHQLEISFPDKEEVVQMTVKKAVIRRIEENPNSTRFRYAVEFLDLGREENEVLKKQIYRIQRDILQKRRLLEGD